MKYTLIILTLLLAFQIQAQDSYTPYFDLDKGIPYYLLADEVNLRAKPDSKSDLITKIPIGTEIKIENIEKTFLSINGIDAPWVKISFKEDGRYKNGYIWSGFLSFHFEGSSVNEDGLQFLVGLAKVEDQGDNQKITLQARVCKDGKELQKIEFEGGGSSMTSRWGKISSPRGMAGIKNIIDFTYADGACGGAFGNEIFFWDGKNFKLVKHLVEGAGDGCFSSQEFIFPKDEGGKAGLILLKNEAGCSEDQGGEYVTDYEYRYMEEYSWENNKLVFLKKYDIK